MAIDLEALRDRESAEKAAQKTRDTITMARSYLMTKTPFFAPLVMHLVPVEAPWCLSNGIPTGATEGKHFYYHPEIMTKGPFKTFKDVVELLCHEVLHAAFSHSLRRGVRNPLLWNYACDYAVNDILVEMGLQLSEGSLYDEKYKGMSSERIYSLLMKDAANFMKKVVIPDWLEKLAANCPGQSPGSGSGKGKKKGDGAGSGSGAGTKKDAKGAGKQGIRDMHLDPSMGVDPKTGQKTGAGAGSGMPGMIDTTDMPEDIKAEVEKIKAEWERRLNAAATAYHNHIKNHPGGKGRGSLPGQIQELIDEIRRPKTSLMRDLSRFVMKAITRDNNYSTMNVRRHSSQGIVYPTKKNDVLDVAVVIDTSGSVSGKDAGFFLGILDELLKKSPVKRIRYMECDTNITKDITITRSKVTFEDLFPKANLPEGSKASISGRGGTSFVPPFEKLRAEKYTPGVLVYLTDGDGGVPDWTPEYPVFWMLNYQTATAPHLSFGYVRGFDETDIEEWERNRQPVAAGPSV